LFSERAVPYVWRDGSKDESRMEVDRVLTRLSEAR
jgi:hypothetical protein